MINYTYALGGKDEITRTDAEVKIRISFSCFCWPIKRKSVTAMTKTCFPNLYYSVHTIFSHTQWVISRYANKYLYLFWQSPATDVQFFWRKTVTYFITVRYFLKLVMPGLCLNFFFAVNAFLSCLLCTETMQTKQNLYRIQRLSLSGDKSPRYGFCCSSTSHHKTWWRRGYNKTKLTNVAITKKAK